MRLRAHVTVWPLLQDGFGMLTPTGMQQLYNLGKNLRKRYVDDMALLSRNYSREFVSVRSTNYDRTLMSAQVRVPLRPGPD